MINFVRMIKCNHFSIPATDFIGTNRFTNTKDFGKVTLILHTIEICSASIAFLLLAPPAFLFFLLLTAALIIAAFFLRPSVCFGGFVPRFFCLPLLLLLSLSLRLRPLLLFVSLLRCL